MKEILTVSQLNNNIKLLFDETFDFLWVEGEVSNLRRPQSGHVYFTLKDDKSQINAVFFRQFGAYCVMDLFVATAPFQPRQRSGNIRPALYIGRR
jgi:exonuclease VII large subunit